MNFENMKIDEIKAVVKYTSTLKEWRAHDRKDHIIGVAFSGDELHDLGYESFSIGENCIFFLNKKDDFTVKVNENALSHSVHFTTAEEIETNSFCIKQKNISEFARRLERIDTQMRLSASNIYPLYSDFYKLLSMFVEVLQKNYSTTDTRMLTAREYIDIHFCESDCLKKLYEMSELSRRHFDHLFKASFDITPGRYITQKKVEMAKQLLGTVNIGFDKIASMCGFSDVYYFSKVFKSETGLTPSAYRKDSLV